MKINLIQIGDTFGSFEAPCYFLKYTVVSPVEKTLYVDGGGAWKRVLKCFAEHDGEWREAAVFVGGDGVWR